MSDSCGVEARRQKPLMAAPEDRPGTANPTDGN